MRCATVFAILVLPAVCLGSETGGMDPRCSAAGSSCDAESLLQTAGVRFQGADESQYVDESNLVPESVPARKGADENAPVPVMAPMKLLEALQVKGNSAVPHLTIKEAHHRMEAGLLQEKAVTVGFKADAQTEARRPNFQSGALFIFALIVGALVLAVAWMAVKQIFGIGCSEEEGEEEDTDLVRGIKRVFGVGYSEAADEDGDVVKSDAVKDSTKDATERSTAPVARSPLDELRAKMQEADLTTSEVSVVKDLTTDTAEIAAAPMARSPLDELRAKMQEADLTASEVSAKVAEPIG